VVYEPHDFVVVLRLFVAYAPALNNFECTIGFTPAISMALSALSITCGCGSTILIYATNKNNIVD
ncbi:hypothetical protein, partial [Phocaeicola sp.]|uniref:hypothetical protein n=1 Tax=Phocaeicola sp. TaxID=2773926 RepID=UPI003AB38FCF